MIRKLFATHPIAPAGHVAGSEPIGGSLTGEGSLKRVLTARHLVMLGIGAVIGWIIVGFVIYGVYGFRHSRLRSASARVPATGE